MNNCTLRNSALAALCLWGLPACSGGGGGGGGGAPSVGNLQVAALKLISPDPTSAHELDLETTINSTLDTPDVSISYYLVHKEDLDAKVAEPRQFLIDTDVIPSVAAGTSTHAITVVIPEDVSPRGDYYLTTRVDPIDQIEETNEDDNVPPESETGIVIPVNHDNIDTPDFTVESVELDDPAIVLTPHQIRKVVTGFVDKREHHAGLTVVCQVTGRKSYSAVSMRIEVVLPNGDTRPLTAWRESKEDYDTEFFADLIPDQPNSIHVDINVPDAVLGDLLRLVLAGERNFGLRVTLNVGESIAEWENGVRRITEREDDVVTLPVVLIDPATIPKADCVKWEQNFKKDWHNKFLGCGVRFHGGTYLDGRGAVAEAEGSLPVKIFRKTFDFFHGEAYGQLSPHKPENTQFNIDVDLLGVTVYHRATQDPTYTYTDTPFKKVESIRKQSIVFCGPVPIVFKAGAQGTVGYKLEFTMDSGNMRLTGTPYAKLTAYASAEVNIVVAKGGIRGVMTLVRDDYENAVSFGEVKLTNGDTAISSTLRMTVTNTLTGPKGRLYLYADYPGVKWCSTILGKVPCGIRTHHKEKTLVKFRTFEKRDVLLNESVTSTVQLSCQ